MDKKIINHLPRVLQLRISPLMVASGCILLNLLCRADILWHANFYWDDFIILADQTPHPSWSQFWISHDGHTMPLGMWIIYTVNDLAPYAWWLPAGILLLGQLVCDILTWRLCLAVLDPSRRTLEIKSGNQLRFPYTIRQIHYLALLPLCLMIFTPLTFTQQTWWSSAVNTVPLSMALLGALLVTFQMINRISQLSETMGTWQIAHKYLWAMGGCLLAIACYEKAIIIPWMVLALIFIDALYRKALPLARKIWLPWLIFSGLTMIYGIWAVARIEQIPGKRSLGQAGELLRLTLNAIFPSSLFGGPWEWIKFAPAPPISVDFVPGKYIAYLVIIFFVRFAYRRRVFGLILCAVGYCILTTLPVDYVRSGPYTSGLLASGLRYSTEYPIVLGVLFALLLRLADRNSAYKYKPISPVWVLWVTIFLLGSLISTHNMVETIAIDGSKEYIRALKWEIRQGHELFDQRLPFYLLTPVALNEDKISRVFASLHPHIVDMKNRLEVIGDDGHLHVIKVMPVRTIEPGCMNLHRISGPLFRIPWMVHLVFPRVKLTTPLSLQLGDEAVIHATIPAGYHELYIAVTGTGRYISVRGLSCITQGEILPAILA